MLRDRRRSQLLDVLCCAVRRPARDVAALLGDPQLQMHTLMRDGVPAGFFVLQVPAPHKQKRPHAHSSTDAGPLVDAVRGACKVAFARAPWGSNISKRQHQLAQG